MKLKKVAYLSSLFRFFLPFLHKVVGETVLPNNFFKNSLTLLRKLLMNLFSKKITSIIKLNYAK
jgi:hypothetical protein